MPEAITLVAVTKTFPARDVRLLTELGIRDVGENRDQEAAPKADDCADLGVRWHFVGQLQTNKVRSVAQYAWCVQSIDRVKLVHALSRATSRRADDHQPGLRCLAQVQLDDDYDARRGGARPAELRAVADAVAEAPGLELAGVMAVAPVDVDPRPRFEWLRSLADQVRVDHPQARWLSAGMTHDLEAAIEFGATHVRIGRALLGERPPLR